MTDSVSPISVIVPTVGRPESLTRLLESLCRQTTRVYEVIVADSSVDSATQRLVADSRWAASGLPIRHLAVQPANAVRQRLAAISCSSGAFLLFLDDDVELEDDCVRAMWDVMRVDTEVAAVTADFNNQGRPNPTRAWRWYMRFILGLDEGSWQGRVVGPLLRFGFDPVPEAPRRVEWFGAGNTLIRRDAYERSGGFSTYFLHRCTTHEDVDLGIRMGRVGKLIFCPGARLGHFHAPGGRVTTLVAAEDDLYNRYLVMRRAQQRTAPNAFGAVLLYFVVETASSTVGAIWRRDGRGCGARLVGRLRALIRILFLPAQSP